MVIILPQHFKRHHKQIRCLWYYQKCMSE